MTEPLLEIVDVAKHYGPNPALHPIRFAVMEGEIFGLLGPNGAGKTTLLSIICGLTEPSAGQVLLHGQPLRSSKDVKRAIGIVPQELAVYESLSARENLVFFGELYGLDGPPLHERVQQLLVAVGLDTRADDRVSVYSGGMKRRLNLAIALVHQPRLLLLDEPTVGVDPQSRNLIFEEVRRLNAAGLTVIYTSHYMEEVAALCTRIGILDRGRLQACDTLPNLLQMLRGLVRCEAEHLPPTFREQLRHIPDCTLRDVAPNAVELDCHDVKHTLLKVVALLHEHDVKLVRLETEEPNLERVFLHLTGRALRD